MLVRDIDGNVMALGKNMSIIYQDKDGSHHKAIAFNPSVIGGWLVGNQLLSDVIQDCFTYHVNVNYRTNYRTKNWR